MQLYGQERLRKRNNYTSADDLKIMVHRFACIEFFLQERALIYTHAHDTLAHAYAFTHTLVFFFFVYIFFPRILI